MDELRTALCSTPSDFLPPGGNSSYKCITFHTFIPEETRMDRSPFTSSLPPDVPLAHQQTLSISQEFLLCTRRPSQPTASSRPSLHDCKSHTSLVGNDSCSWNQGAKATNQNHLNNIVGLPL